MRRRPPATVRSLLGRTRGEADPAPLAAAAFLLSCAGLVLLSLLVPGYIRDGWATAFALSAVPCVLVAVPLLVRRRLPGRGILAVVLYGDAAIVLSAFASADRVGTTAGALLSLPMLFTSTFLAPRWVAVQAVLSAGCAWVIVSLVPAPLLVRLIRTSVLVVACVCPAIIVTLLRAHLDRAVHTDPLTGLANRRGLMARLPALVARARRHRLPVSVLLVDVDHFKRVNDHFGHVTGDEVLRTVARTLLDACDPGTLVVRFGGEELAVLLVAPCDQVLAVAERVRSQVQRDAVAWEVTVSVGCASAEPGGRDGGTDEDLLDALLRGADERLCEAKRSGRNRVVPAPATTGR